VESGGKRECAQMGGDWYSVCVTSPAAERGADTSGSRTPPPWAWERGTIAAFVAAETPAS
jgi:hypothetical protein